MEMVGVKNIWGYCKLGSWLPFRVGDAIGVQREGSKRFARSAMRTAKSPVSSMAAALSALRMRFPKTKQAIERTVGFLGYDFMTESVACGEELG